MPKTKAQFEEIKAQRKQDILNHALYLFAIKGYAAVTMDEIANECKCSHGLIFHYFSNKENLFHELMETVVDEKFRDIVSKINTNQPTKFIFIDSIEAALNALKDEDDRYACTIYLLLNLYLQRSVIPKPRNDKYRNTPVISTLSLLEKGVKEGVFYENNPKELLIAVISTLKGLAYNRINIGNKFTCPKSEIITRMVIKK